MDYKANNSNSIIPYSKTMEVESDTNYIYVNVVLTNTEQFDINASVKDVRRSNIVDKACDWEMSIVRFSISSNEVPIFTPVIPSSTFPLRSNMSITLCHSGVYFPQFINATPQEVSDGVFSYQSWLNHLNDAAQLSFSTLKAAFPGASGTQPPLFFLDSKSSLISMYVEDFYLQTNPNRIRIFMNQQLQNIMDLSFSSSGSVPAQYGADYELSVTSSSTLLPAAPRTNIPLALSALAGSILQVTQEFPSLDEWNDCQRIFFTTGLIPVNGELLPNRTTQEQQGNISSNSQQIVTDFLVNREGSEPTRHNFVYIPTVYRMVSLLGNSPIKDIDISAFCQSYVGETKQIRLAPRTNMSMKIMLARKNRL